MLDQAGFQNYLAGWTDEMQSLAEDVQTWAGNKADANENFDFTTAKADLESAKASFISNVETVKAL